MHTIFLPKYIPRTQAHLVLQYKKVSLVVVSLLGSVWVIISRIWVLPYIDQVLLVQGKGRPLQLEFFVSTSLWVAGLLGAFAVAVWSSRGEEMSFEKRLNKLATTKQILTSHLVGPTHGFKLYSIMGFIVVYLFLALALPLFA